MAGLALSPETERRLRILFSDEDADVARTLLVNELGRNLPLCDAWPPEGIERLRFATLKLSEGKLNRLRDAIRLAKIDWRDLLMAAGFGHDVRSHLSWEPPAR